MDGEAIETIDQIPIKNHPGKTWSIKYNNIDKYKRSEYENDGHSISHFPFENPYLLEWLFRQTISNKINLE